MTEGARILEQDSFGPKVYRLRDGNMLKLFRRKRLLSSALLRPHSQRFCSNADALQARGIPTLQPLALYRLDDPAWTAVLYQPLPGETLSQLLRDDASFWQTLLPQLASFIGLLHASGVYFRSLHLGNIVRTPDGLLGLIDIADLQLRRPPLSQRLIRRNREHFDKYLRKEGFAFDSTQLWDYGKPARVERS
ncbi:BUD32 family EKC/KEOPS complex subunit [Geopseudomonas guangdongensis]|nr:toluene tolerance protein [Pseudomonas guangdongensis]